MYRQQDVVSLLVTHRLSHDYIKSLVFAEYLTWAGPPVLIFLTRAVLHNTVVFKDNTWQAFVLVVTYGMINSFTK